MASKSTDYPRIQLSVHAWMPHGPGGCAPGTARVRVGSPCRARPSAAARCSRRTCC